jgi:hypothetical protein
MAATDARAARNGQDGEPSRTLVQILLAGETQDRPVSWQDVAQQTGLSAAAPTRCCVRNAAVWPPATATRPAVTTRRPDHDTSPRPDKRLMPERGRLTGPEAARRRRAWLDSRHRWHRDLVLILFRYAPEVEVARALDQLPAGELSHLARLLSQATDLHQVACGIACDLHQRLDGRPAGPPSDQPGPSVASTTHP